MKYTQSVLLLFTCFFGFLSCQRELSFEQLPLSAGTLKSAGGGCLPSVINGVYKAGTALTAANYIDVQVDVSVAGDYTISSDSLNGVSFLATGTFVSAGLSTVRLAGKGVPIAVGVNNFKISYNAGNCNVSITTVASNAADAVFSYATAATGDCSGAVINGIYKATVPTDATNTVQLQVNVTTAGPYNISAQAVNGITFSAGGVFAATGVQPVTLVAAGIPTASGNFNIIAIKGSSSCTFTVAVGQAGATPAVFTVGGAASTCTGFTLAGTYTSGTAMTTANTAKVEVTVTTPGTFTISTAAVNGVSFSAAGTFPSAGMVIVTLTASGTPLAAGAKTFAVSAGSNSCSFVVNFGAPAQPAVFILAGAPGQCTAASVSGVYQAGSALTIANTVTIQVNVTTAGSYSISTPLVNGMQFAASGIFTATGNAISVKLVGIGKPLQPGTTTLAPTMGTSSCTFDVDVIPAPTGTFNCKIDGVFISFDNRSGAEVFDDITGVPVPYLFLDGFASPPNGDFVPELQLFITKNDNSQVNAGTYDENHWVPPGTYRIEVDLKMQNPDLSVTIWNNSSNFLPPAHPPFKIIITSRTSTNVKGTFSGTMMNTLQGGTLKKVITEGVFDLPIK